uniref:NADH-ubiquinone oxidoreductase chain 6 n=1 Tax=Conwentzia sinica TaxID=450904 RepID=A0A7U1AQD3_9NEOP|nr:NADH dehydrogenase subunit 6 [Conwentzia sinica]QQY84958.1 NADH dehydrogenase subunit 6 [Conwentzia sinica]
MFNLLMTMSIMNNFLFISMKSPMSMGLMLMIQIISMSLILGMLSINFWFSFILFIVMIGGLMVLFIYMTSLAPNNLFKMNNKFMMILIVTMFIIMMYFYLTSELLIFKKNLDMMSFMDTQESSLLIKLYNLPMNKLTWLMIMYLLMTLIIAAKLVKSNLGSIRQFN